MSLSIGKIFADGGYIVAIEGETVTYAKRVDGQEEPVIKTAYCSYEEQASEALWPDKNTYTVTVEFEAESGKKPFVKTVGNVSRAGAMDEVMSMCTDLERAFIRSAAVVDHGPIVSK